jgi:hypothetical protein
MQEIKLADHKGHVNYATRIFGLSPQMTLTTITFCLQTMATFTFLVQLMFAWLQTEPILRCTELFLKPMM